MHKVLVLLLGIQICLSGCFEAEPDTEYSFESGDPRFESGIKYFTAKDFLKSNDHSLVLNLQNVQSSENILLISVNASQTDHADSTSASIHRIDAEGFEGYEQVLKNSSIREVVKPTDSAANSKSTSPASDLHIDLRNYVQSAVSNQNPKRLREAVQKIHRREISIAKCVAPYVVGVKECAFQIMNPKYQFGVVKTKLIRSSKRAYWFLDQDDATDFSEAELDNLVSDFDDKIFPSDVKYFGEPTDLDQNQKIIIVLSHRLAETTDGRYLVGYVAPWDLFPTGMFPVLGHNGDEYTTMPSNGGEILYLATPRIIETLTGSREKYFNELIRPAIAHELKHLLTDSYRATHGFALEPSWIEEPTAVAAQELAGLGTQNNSYIQIRARAGLSSPDSVRVAYEKIPDNKVRIYSMYGFNFLFLWRLAEKVGHEKFWKSWTQDPLVGIPNLEAHSGISFSSALLDWAMTLYFDHQELGSTKIRKALEQYSYQSLNLRESSWEPLNTFPIRDKNVGFVHGMRFYTAKGANRDLKLTIRPDTLENPEPYFILIRY